MLDEAVHHQDLATTTQGAVAAPAPLDASPDPKAPRPSTRAATVLDAVGCDWIDRGRRQPRAIMPDPTLPLIAAERESYAALKGIWAEHEAHPSKALLQREDELNAINMAARRAVMAAQPTTSAGLLAMVELHVERNVDHIEDDCEVVFDRARTFLSRQTASTAVRDPVLDLLDREAELHRRSDAALSQDWDGEGQVAADRQREAEAALMSTAPMTVAGFAAVVERWIERENCVAPGDGAAYDNIISLIKAGKATAQPATRQPDPVDVLFSEWIETQEAMREQVELDYQTGQESDDPSSPFQLLLNHATEIEEKIIETAPSPVRAAAVAVFEIEMTEHYETPRMLDRGACDTTWLALDTLALVRPHLTGRLAEIVGDLLDHPDRPFRDSKLHRLWTTPERAAELCERQREPMLQAAE